MNLIEHSKLQRITKGLLPATYLIWAGLILGVSFIATPVKFQAPNLTMPVALEVGKATFHLFNAVEWGVIALLVILTKMSSDMSRKWIICAFMLAVLSIQSFWLLPALDIRTDLVIAGGQPSSGHLHLFYIFIECFKLFVTLMASWMFLRERT